MEQGTTFLIEISVETTKMMNFFFYGVNVIDRMKLKLTSRVVNFSEVLFYVYNDTLVNDIQMTGGPKCDLSTIRNEVNSRCLNHQ